MGMVKLLPGLAALSFCAGCAKTVDATSSTAALASESDIVSFTAALKGDGALAATPSKATGTARITIDREAQSIDLNLDITGITIEALWDTLIPAAIGPIHFHAYAANDLAGQAALTFPVPFGPAYVATDTGFTVTVTDYRYEDGVAATGSQGSFEEFVAGLGNGTVILNVHTDAYPDGEIGGQIAPTD